MTSPTEALLQALAELPDTPDFEPEPTDQHEYIPYVPADRFGIAWAYLTNSPCAVNSCGASRLHLTHLVRS